jgi:U3 small nucleolar RNA-associated protein 11
LKALRQKAADRNPDEFYYGMMSRKGPTSWASTGKRWDGTVEGDRGNKSMDVATVRLLKTQDMGYVRTMRTIVAKELASLEQRLVQARGVNAVEDGDADDDDDEMPMPARRPTPKPRKIVFVDDEAERDQVMQEAPNNLDETREDGEEPFEGFDDENSDGGSKPDTKAERIRKLKQKRNNARQKLKALAEAEIALEEQRAKMAKTATSGGLTKKGQRIKVKARKS